MSKRRLAWRFSNEPLDRVVVSDLEDEWEVTFPADYVQCVLVNDGARPKPKAFDFPGRKGAVFSHLLSFRDAATDDDDLSIRQMYSAVKRRLPEDRKSTRLNSSHLGISYAVFCL